MTVSFSFRVISLASAWTSGHVIDHRNSSWTSLTWVDNLQTNLFESMTLLTQCWPFFIMIMLTIAFVTQKWSLSSSVVHVLHHDWLSCGNLVNFPVCCFEVVFSRSLSWPWPSSLISILMSILIASPSELPYLIPNLLSTVISQTILCHWQLQAVYL